MAVSADRSAAARPQRDFYGIAEIADALGLNRQLVTAWRRRRSHGMPEPDAELAAGPLWRGESIEPWIGAVHARLTAGPGAPITPALVRRAVRRTLRLLALLLEDQPRPRLVTRALSEVRELLPLVDEVADDGDPIGRGLRRLLAPIERIAVPDLDGAAEDGGADEKADEQNDEKTAAARAALRSELLAALPTLPDLLNAAERADGGPAAP